MQKYLKKRKCRTLRNYYVTGYFGCMDIARVLIFFFFAWKFHKMFYDRHTNYSSSVVYIIYRHFSLQRIQNHM